MSELNSISSLKTSEPEDEVLGKAEIDKKVHSVTEYIAMLNGALIKVTGEIIGEITGFKKGPNGHVYFSLKDKETGDILPCIIWNSVYLLNGFELENGIDVLLKGKPNFYGSFGKLSFHAKSAEIIGEGVLKKAYDKLKAKLAKEGLFAEKNKRHVPMYPEKIGVITSTAGAVVHDFINNLGKYSFKVKIMDTRVEGQEAGKDLTLSVKAFRKEDIDVLVLIRGGGSIQSLAGFDNEILVREIVNFPVPVITGIGHHRDVPLAALAADKTVSTPSIAAGLVNSSWQEASRLLASSEQDIFEAFEQRVGNIYEQLKDAFNSAKKIFENIFNIYDDAEKTIKENFIKIKYSLRSLRKTIDTRIKSIFSKYSFDLENVQTKITLTPISNIFAYKITVSKGRFDNFKRIIEINDPERQLNLGYSLVRHNGKLIKNAKDLTVGDDIETQFCEGEVKSRIKSLR